MPIEYSTATEIKARGVKYTALPTKILRNFRNPDALTIWAYLLSLPADWIVRRKNVRDQLGGMSKQKYQKAMRDLRDAGLVRDWKPRDSKGRFLENQIIVSSYPHAQYSGSLDSPNAGCQSHLSNDQLVKEESITRTSVKQPKKVSSRDTTLEEDLSDTSWAE